MTERLEIPEGLREELARTLDPGAFEAPNNEHAMRRALRVARQKIAFDLADRILAAFHVLPRSEFDAMVSRLDASLHPRSSASAWRMGKLRRAMRAALLASLPSDKEIGRE